jgi:hypothetical protein
MHTLTTLKRTSLITLQIGAKAPLSSHNQIFHVISPKRVMHMIWLVYRQTVIDGVSALRLQQQLRRMREYLGKNEMPPLKQTTLNALLGPKSSPVDVEML